ncbi:MAG TPA: ImmA/IrrE family metallo-endopeptidase [Kofleriaceae bacterium]
MREDRFRDVRVEALKMLAEHHVKRPEDIDLDAIAESMDATITYDDLDGATARVMRLGSRATIRISNRIQEVGARRSASAHEIGHLRLGHEVPTGDSDHIVERICKPLAADHRISERAASVFSSELVMPEPLVQPRCRVSCVTLDPVREIAREFTTSVLASAMRFIELSSERCAVAYSVLGRVHWLKPSATFPNWVPRGRRLDPASAASEYYEGGTIDNAPRVLTADIWLPPDFIDGSQCQIVEHSAAIPELGAVLSLLWIPEREAHHLDLESHASV